MLAKRFSSDKNSRSDVVNETVSFFLNFLIRPAQFTKIRSVSGVEDKLRSLSRCDSSFFRNAELGVIL